MSECRDRSMGLLMSGIPARRRRRRHLRRRRRRLLNGVVYVGGLRCKTPLARSLARCGAHPPAYSFCRRPIVWKKEKDRGGPANEHFQRQSERKGEGGQRQSWQAGGASLRLTCIVLAEVYCSTLPLQYFTPGKRSASRQRRTDPQSSGPPRWSVRRGES